MRDYSGPASGKALNSQHLLVSRRPLWKREGPVMADRRFRVERWISADRQARCRCNPGWLCRSGLKNRWSQRSDAPWWPGGPTASHTKARWPIAQEGQGAGPRPGGRTGRSEPADEVQAVFKIFVADASGSSTPFKQAVPGRVMGQGLVPVRARSGPP